MNNFSKVFVALGVIGLGSVIASPAFSQQAYASGSATFIQMNGASQSIGGEIAAPSGSSLLGVVTVAPVQSGTLAVNTNTFTNLTVTPGAITAAPAGSSFTAAAAARLSVPANTLADNVSLIRAGAGIDGLD